MTTPWLGHENGCSVQWSPICTCGPEDVDLSETPPEPRYLTTLSDGDGDLG